MNKELAPAQLEEVAEEIYAARNQFIRATLTQLVAWKVYLGRKLAGASYGDHAVEYISEKTGINAGVLHDAQRCYRMEKLSPAKEKAFIKSFPEKYPNWSEYRNKVLYLNTRSERESAGCDHQWVCKKCDKIK